MTNIQFYNTGKSLDDALLYTCRLIQKVLRRRLDILVNVPDETIGKQLDELLWGFEPTAFLPHGLGHDEHEAVTISWADEPGEHHQVMINLATQIPSWHGRFETVLEIIYDQDQVIERKRESFRYYKQRGYPLRYHELSQAG